ncbi:glycosyltransferase [Agromyces sp. MMS24-K17]|uniref:glycosyltransferase n=1 Tax=Agromyces sp. MMS24-K17 TaxID=3372850 RepID=UPI003754A0BE
MTGLIVHEWIERTGGSENVLERMVRAFPDADVLCLWNNAGERFASTTIRETWLAKTPFRTSKALALPMTAVAWRTRQEEADWVLVSSHSFAHHVRVRRSEPAIPKLVYTHTPARYIWASSLDPRGRSMMARVASVPLRGIDARRARESTTLAANSWFVAERIRRAWGREAEVIYPPVDVRTIQHRSEWLSRLTERELELLDRLPSEFILGASRFVSYKRLEAVMLIAEANRTPAVIAGAGPGRDNLANLASRCSVDVRIVDSPSSELLYALYERALVFAFLAVEDFGIMPVEAMAAGTPVIVNRRGGAYEAVEAISGGVAMDGEGWAESRSALRAAGRVDRSRMQVDARRFDAAEFDHRLLAWHSTHTRTST